jgi:hypothetical protein
LDNQLNRRRSLQNGWNDEVNQTTEKEKIMKDTIILPMVVTAVVARAIMAKEEAEEAEEVTSGEAARIVII